MVDDVRHSEVTADEHMANEQRQIGKIRLRTRNHHTSQKHSLALSFELKREIDSICF